jgi:translation initiation factor IF-3
MDISNKGNTNLKDQKKDVGPLINEKIRAPRVQLIAEDGHNIGIVTRGDALRLAQEAGLDLVIIADEGREGVPVAKVMNFGKALYEKKKKQHEAKKHQKVIQVKEVKMGPKIGEHDFQTKMRQVIDFLNEGKRVKITLFFKGRENATRMERGTELFDKIQQVFEKNDLLKNLGQEPDSRMGSLWSRIYFLKNVK